LNRSARICGQILAAKQEQTGFAPSLEHINVSFEMEQVSREPRFPIDDPASEGCF
jgi:hypothetical protein